MLRVQGVGGGVVTRGRTRRFPGGTLEAHYQPHEEAAMREIATSGAPTALREAKVFHWLKAELDAVLLRDDDDDQVVLEAVPVGYLPDANRPAPTSGRATSAAAAGVVFPRTGTLRRHVLDAIGAAGERGATDDDLLASTGLAPNTLRPRRWELVSGGWVVDSGRKRPTASGSDAVVWVVSRLGRAYLDGAAA